MLAHKAEEAALRLLKNSWTTHVDFYHSTDVIYTSRISWRWSKTVQERELKASMSKSIEYRLSPRYGQMVVTCMVLIDYWICIKLSLMQEHDE